MDEPCGIDGWRTYGIHPNQWRGSVTAYDGNQDAAYTAALVADELRDEWDIHGAPATGPVHVHVWRNWEGTSRDAVFTMEVHPDGDAR